MDYIGSDFHFGHANILKHCDRPFNSVEHMNKVLTSNWNNIVSNEDTVFVVGDFFMGEKVLWPSHRQKLNGRIVLVMGNHDEKSKKATHEENIEFMKSCGIETVVDEYYYTDENNIVYWLNHFPPDGFDRFTDERGYKRPVATQYYDVLVHGHVHSKDKFNGYFEGKPVVHVGADAWNYTPFSFAELRKVIPF